MAILQPPALTPNKQKKAPNNIDAFFSESRCFCVLVAEECNYADFENL